MYLDAEPLNIRRRILCSTSRDHSSLMSIQVLIDTIILALLEVLCIECLKLLEVGMSLGMKWWRCVGMKLGGGNENGPGFEEERWLIYF